AAAVGRSTRDGAGRPRPPAAGAGRRRPLRGDAGGAAAGALRDRGEGRAGGGRGGGGGLRGGGPARAEAAGVALAGALRAPEGLRARHHWGPSAALRISGGVISPGT